MTNSPPEILRDVVNGDTAGMFMIESWTHQELTQAADGLTLILDPSAVARVLKAHAARRIRSSEAQRWAEFIRYGHVAKRSDGPIRPIDIEYDSAHEDVIAEAISRLDELGDLIDGEIQQAEVKQLLKALGQDG